MYCRVKNYPIQEILDIVIDASEIKELKCVKPTKKEYKVAITRLVDGYAVKMDSLRYQCFKLKSTVCCHCGLKATHFGLEVEHCNMDVLVIPYHFNLYGIKNGKEVLFTKDHILPKSKQGKDVIENMQTMCTICNCKKGNKIE